MTESNKIYYTVHGVRFDAIQPAIDHCGNLTKKSIDEKYSFSWLRSSSPAIHKKIVNNYDLLHVNVVQLPDIIDVEISQYAALYIYLRYTQSLIFNNEKISLIQPHYHFIVQFVLSMQDVPSEYWNLLGHMSLNDDNCDQDLMFGSRGENYELIQQIYYKYQVIRKVSSDHWINSGDIVDKLKHTFFEYHNYKQFIKGINYIIPQEQAIDGYKAFNLLDSGQLQCGDYTFDTSIIHHQPDFVAPCTSGFHFCDGYSDTGRYYNLYDSNVVVHKVKGWGVVMNHDDKIVCSHLQILDRIR